MKKTIVVAFMALIMALGGAAVAATNTYNMAVACDGVTVKNGASQSHAGGTLSIRQNSADPASNTWVSARSANNNDLQFKFVSNGATATWTSVLSSTYTVRAYRSGYLDCNGFWLGSGNYTLNYTFTTT